MYEMQMLNIDIEKCFSVVSRCTMERLSRFTPLQNDIAKEEGIIDQYIDLLRRDKFDENTSIDNVNKAINCLEVHFFLTVSDTQIRSRRLV